MDISFWVLSLSNPTHLLCWGYGRFKEGLLREGAFCPACFCLYIRVFWPVKSILFLFSHHSNLLLSNPFYPLKNTSILGMVTSLNLALLLHSPTSLDGPAGSPLPRFPVFSRRFSNAVSGALTSSNRCDRLEKMVVLLIYKGCATDFLFFYSFVL